jgi:hypothetical protein
VKPRPSSQESEIRQAPGEICLVIWGDAIDDISKRMKSFSKGCRNEDLAINVYKSENRKTSCCCILLSLLDHFYNLIVILF